MSQRSIAQLTEAAAAAEEPACVTEIKTKFGGVDPLGLRQINFDLMDEVFPGLNNVARHVRPFVVVTWAWRRAHQLAKEKGAKQIHVRELKDFVDRIEVIFALSQFLLDKKSDLPGGDVLAPFLQRERITFGGADWKKLCAKRSTALSDPANYGPGLKMLGWLSPLVGYTNVMVPMIEVTPALDALEAELARVLGHEVFSSFGSVEVNLANLEKWGNLWSLSAPTASEAKVMREQLQGLNAPSERRLGIALLRAAIVRTKSTDANILREAMCGPPSKFAPSSELIVIRDAWRRAQMRQLFRLSLESLFYWLVQMLMTGPRSMDNLVDTFMGLIPKARASRTRNWLAGLASTAPGLTAILDRLQQELGERDNVALPHSIVLGLAVCLNESVERELFAQQAERLPLSRAHSETEARASASVPDFIRHVIESWVFAQHTYWAVGRGLADARSNGKMLLRLRIILDEGGWMLTPGAVAGDPPRPTGDRLQTAISLGEECGLFR